MAIISLVTMLSLAPVPSPACTVCHSKDPKMRKMHQELGYRDCFTCHGRGLSRDPKERRLQQTTDSRCIRCHGEIGTNSTPRPARQRTFPAVLR